MLLSGWNADIPDIDNFFYALLHSESAGDLNLSFFSDAVFDDAVKKAQTEIDPAKRKALYAKAWARYREEQPTIPLVHVKQLVALSKRVDYKMHPIEYRFYKASFKE
jgi:ABC-type transport system substrate-binding protein